MIWNGLLDLFFVAGLLLVATVLGALHLLVNRRNRGRQCTTCVWYHQGMHTPLGTRYECARPHPETGRPVMALCVSERSNSWPFSLIAGECGKTGRYHTIRRESTVYSNEEFKFGEEKDASSDDPAKTD